MEGSVVMQKKEAESFPYKFIGLALVCAVVAILCIELVKQNVSASRSAAKSREADISTAPIMQTAGTPQATPDIRPKAALSAFPGDTDVVSNLREQRFEIMERQTDTLTKESESIDDNAGPRALALPRERIRALEKKGAMIN